MLKNSNNILSLETNIDEINKPGFVIYEHIVLDDILIPVHFWRVLEEDHRQSPPRQGSGTSRKCSLEHQLALLEKRNY